jgi:hypothetical protein
VQWLENQKGIELNRHGIFEKSAPRGIVYSNDTFIIPTENKEGRPSISIELYLEPGIEPFHNSGIILSFTENGQQTSLLLAQRHKYLLLRIPNLQSDNKNDYHEVGVSDVLPRDSTRLIAVTSGDQGTKCYVNGEIKEHFPDFFLVSDEKSVSGKMIVGISANGETPWAGKIYGIGIYEDELPAQKIKRHYQTWHSNNEDILSSEESILALYSFDEGQGDLARNSAGNDKHLVIPERFTFLETVVLEPPWIRFKFNIAFIFDFTINLLGFIPFGIMFTLFLRRIYRINGRRLFLVTLIIGGAMSLIIELLQVLMPQRHSSLMDLVLNMLGLCVGFVLVQFILMLRRKKFAY